MDSELLCKVVQRIERMAGIEALLVLAQVPRLVGAVANAGGLGILASATMTYDELVALTVKLYLEKHGCNVTHVASGTEALALLAVNSPDAVLLDCQMPVMDGFATCRALRALPGCAELPVLAITAHSHSGDRERCLAAGMSDYLAKPVKFDELRVLLHDWVLCRPATVSGGAAPV